MLEKCAPGHDIWEGTHKFVVTWQERTYPDLQKAGQHGKDELQLNSVEKMVQVLKIDLECARKWVPSIRIKSAQAGNSEAAAPASPKSWGDFEVRWTCGCEEFGITPVRPSEWCPGCSQELYRVAMEEPGVGKIHLVEATDAEIVARETQ